MHCQGKRCDNCIWFSFSMQKKKKPRRSFHSRPVSGKGINATASWCGCLSTLASKSRSRKGVGKRKNTRRLSCTVNHREPLCLQLPLSEELCRAETMALLWSCISSTSSTASDEWWVKRAADFGCTTLKYFIKDGKRPCASITQQILPFAVEQTNSFLSAGSIWSFWFTAQSVCKSYIHKTYT